MIEKRTKILSFSMTIMLISLIIGSGLSITPQSNPRASAIVDTVDLGSAGNFVILAKTAISTTTSTAIIGDIGLSPAQQSYLTGFGEVLDTSNIFATSTMVTGKIYASDMANPTPAKLTNVIADMEIAYTDASSRTAEITDLNSGSLGGDSLVPNVYRWTTAVSISSDITLLGNENNVWIFQIAQDLTVTGGITITLSGGAQAKNVFWQVAGKVNIGASANFKGTILAQSDINMASGAVLVGRALSQTKVSLIANSISTPIENPTVAFFNTLIFGIPVWVWFLIMIMVIFVVVFITYTIYANKRCREDPKYRSMVCRAKYRTYKKDE